MVSLRKRLRRSPVVGHDRQLHPGLAQMAKNPRRFRERLKHRHVERRRQFSQELTVGLDPQLGQDHAMVVLPA